MDDLKEGAKEDSTMHTIDIHWFLFRESPTNTSLFPLSFSINAVALNLWLFHQLKTVNKSKLARNDKKK